MAVKRLSDNNQPYDFCTACTHFFLLFLPVISWFWSKMTTCTKIEMWINCVLSFLPASSVYSYTHNGNFPPVLWIRQCMWLSSLFFFVLPFLCYSEFLPTLVYYIMLHLVLPHLVVSVWLWGTVVTLWPLTGFFCFLWWWAMSWPFCCACQLHCVDFYFGMDCD